MLMRGRRQYYREFWALKNISFEVMKGETVGIVGRNGSGKSTLLQLICGTLNPTAGNIELSGRIAALLELGSGFNLDFTGRENIYMNGSVLGLSKAEIDSRFEDIVSFADIGDFVEQPVKMYSSGMVVRLAFAVAINVDPQILVIDEALSVGDEIFQRKCFAKIEAVKQKGVTILFVSHSGSTVVELCDRTLLLDKGELLAVGAPKTIVGRYQRLLYASEDKRDLVRKEIQFSSEVQDSKKRFGMSYGVANIKTNSDSSLAEEDEYYDENLKPRSTITYVSKGVKIESPQIFNQNGNPINCLRRGSNYRYIYSVFFERGATNVRFGMLIKTLTGVELGGSVSASGIQDAISYIEPGSQVRVEFRFQCLLNSGVYFLNAGVVGTEAEEETYLHRLLDAVMFRVLPNQDSLSTGIIHFNCTPDIILLENCKFTTSG
jgi:lipopolysaccharide transport system ATP-binding protein